MKKNIVVLLFIMVIGFITCSTTEVVAQEQQVQQIKTTEAQGNLTELSRVLGKAKAYVIDLEKNGRNTLTLNFTIDQTKKAIQGTKDLLYSFAIYDVIEASKIVSRCGSFDGY